MTGTEDQVLYYKGRISRLTSLIMRHSFNKGPKDQELNVNIPSGTVILLWEDQRNMDHRFVVRLHFMAGRHYL